MTVQEQLINKLLRVPYVLHAVVRSTPHRPKYTVLFLHGIGTSSVLWEQVADKLPDEVRVVRIDLLGFGQSPKPKWVTYNARVQARSVMYTYFRLRMRGKVIIVGHSLGALVAVEMTKRYPLFIRSLILCSPPFYLPVTDDATKLPRAETALKSIYKTVHNHPERFMKIVTPAVKYKLLNATFNVTEDNLHSYVEALESAIINQTSYADALDISVPTTILHGSLDPVVRLKTLKSLATQNESIQLKTVLSSHEIKSTYRTAVIKEIYQHLDSSLKG
jgi:pimeloyl-ACP methyl ester carboxylesterase